MKVWFITGTPKGFGRIWAQAAPERGDKVTATARDVRALSDLAGRYGDDLLPLYEQRIATWEAWDGVSETAHRAATA
jgi:NADP-dependent 3-hydroxy acid dehydrogenase YdfG